MEQDWPAGGDRKAQLGAKDLFLQPERNRQLVIKTNLADRNHRRVGKKLDESLLDLR